MTLFFETIKWIFILSTMMIILMMIYVLMSGQNFFTPDQLETLQSVMMPAYLIIVGIVIGYIIDLAGMNVNEDKQTRQNNSNTAFVQGVIIGISLALVYILVG